MKLYTLLFSIGLLGLFILLSFIGLLGLVLGYPFSLFNNEIIYKMLYTYISVLIVKVSLSIIRLYITNKFSKENVYNFLYKKYLNPKYILYMLTKNFICTNFEIYIICKYILLSICYSFGTPIIYVLIQCFFIDIPDIYKNLSFKNPDDENPDDEQYGNKKGSSSKWNKENTDNNNLGENSSGDEHGLDEDSSGKTYKRCPDITLTDSDGKETVISQDKGTKEPWPKNRDVEDTKKLMYNAKIEVSKMNSNINTLEELDQECDELFRESGNLTDRQLKRKVDHIDDCWNDIALETANDTHAMKKYFEQDELVKLGTNKVLKDKLILPKTRSLKRKLDSLEDRFDRNQESYLSKTQGSDSDSDSDSDS